MQMLDTAKFLKLEKKSYFIFQYLLCTGFRALAMSLVNASCSSLPEVYKMCVIRCLELRARQRLLKMLLKDVHAVIFLISFHL